eukprot:TRINITY_DN423_c1_g1_i2.p1 TRINITY_DN423_c1_g1~~TRINITY_DN423_c1_g1_i2.p1  ORF type:complete len:400 (+),score=24.21 TRINITY_DN423_c1_g1_i2:75-1202(+)
MNTNNKILKSDDSDTGSSEDSLKEPLVNADLEAAEETKQTCNKRLCCIWFLIVLSMLLIAGIIQIVITVDFSQFLRPSSFAKTPSPSNPQPLPPALPPSPLAPPPPPSPPSPPPSPPPPPVSSQVMVEIRDSLEKGVQEKLSSWVGNDPCNAWQGVECNEYGRITQINLGEGEWEKNSKGTWEYVKNSVEDYVPNLQISLPIEISKLKDLEFLGLDSTGLSRSPLPPEFSVLTNMKKFVVSNNFISGTLPKEYSTWQNIQSFDLQTNFMKGKIPSQYSTWTNLEYFNITHNGLTGKLPVELSGWKSIEYFDCTKNALVGSIPQEYSQLLGTLTQFYVIQWQTLYPCIDRSTMGLFKQTFDFSSSDVFDVSHCKFW